MYMYYKKIKMNLCCNHFNIKLKYPGKCQKQCDVEKCLCHDDDGGKESGCDSSMRSYNSKNTKQVEHTSRNHNASIALTTMQASAFNILKKKKKKKNNKKT